MIEDIVNNGAPQMKIYCTECQRVLTICIFSWCHMRGFIMMDRTQNMVCCRYKKKKPTLMSHVYV